MKQKEFSVIPNISKMERDRFNYDDPNAYLPIESMKGFSSINDLVENKEYLLFLSEYHKRFYYLLDYGKNNDGGISYNPPSWSEKDNIFPNDSLERGSYPFNHIEFAAKIRSFDLNNEMGDILEFGVCSGTTLRDIANINPDKRVHGFDHFLGLEQTKMPTPDYSGWHEGAFKEPVPLNQVIDNLSQFDNISLIVEDVHKLEEPSEYEISKICAVHIDVDIYEPTVSSLNFVDKCEWDKIYMRFDDWHGHESDYDNHERLACKEWIEKNGYKFDLLKGGLSGEMIVYR